VGGALPLMLFVFMVHAFFSAARMALARVFLSTSPVKGSHNSKAFGKKIRSRGTRRESGSR